jgi:hypothetical protein
MSKMGVVWSSELETLDQLFGGELSLAVTRTVYTDDASFARGVHALLLNREVELLSADGVAVPQWRWRGIFVDGRFGEEMRGLKLRITDRGSQRVA